LVPDDGVRARREDGRQTLELERDRVDIEPLGIEQGFGVGRWRDG